MSKKKKKQKSDIEQMAELIAGESTETETVEVERSESGSEEITTDEAVEVKEAEKPETSDTKEASAETTTETTTESITETKSEETVKEATDKGASETASEDASEKKVRVRKVREKKERKHPAKDKMKEEDEYRRAEIKKYVKYAVSGVVAVALIVVCGVTLSVNNEARRAGTGTVMKLTDVSEGLMPFSGITFSAEPITYEDMKNKNYTSARLEEIEAENERIDKILAERQAQREKKEKESEKATKVIEATGISEYDPDDRRIIIPKTTTRVSTSYSYAGSLNPRTSITLADANGKYEDCGNFILTAYCPCPICCGQWSNMVDPHTASGAPAVAGVTVAVDPKVFPYGTKLMINGQIYTAQDCGGAIIGNHIDIYFNTHAEACQFGRQEAHVYRVIE